MNLGDLVYVRFTTNCGDIIFANGESPEFKAGQIIDAFLSVYASPTSFCVEIDWGCGQHARVWASLSKIEIVDPLEVIALVADGQLTIDVDGTVMHEADGT